MMPLSTHEWSLPVWAVLAAALAAAVLVAVAVVMGVFAGRASRRARAGLAALEERVGELQRQVDSLPGSEGLDPGSRRQPGSTSSTGPVSEPEPDRREYVITSLGGAETAVPAEATSVTLSAPAFADAVLRESVVHTASFLHGVRRALAPETRNRIRFEMKRELKRSRKERKVELKQALREYRARHRAEVAPDLEDGAA